METGTIEVKFNEVGLQLKVEHQLRPLHNVMAIGALATMLINEASWTLEDVHKAIDFHMDTIADSVIDQNSPDFSVAKANFDAVNDF